MTLNACPFCGSKLDIRDASHCPQIAGQVTFWVECQKCNATGPERFSREEAEEAWNDRRSN